MFSPFQNEHCEINVNPEDWSVTVIPFPGARTCINGNEVSKPTLLRNGDRIFWGTNHFFRINCPRNMNNSDPATPAVFDWKMAQEEVMQAANDPIQVQISSKERYKKHSSAFNAILYSYIRHYRVEEKYASATVHYKTITFWETPFMNSNFGSYQK